ncbi:hypothetical protein [Rubellimicrobium aerolatum]|uniref:Uncharacterized protein n=1 Tax=Rubellimicrobium aerolatum TaxID=490979 RepID=A0ABW0SA98_9RHOB|nr:hypothetical protein [Rubellimicrobium aerolatum]MBP1805214.1 putative membrane protein YqiK [Rubellimicrobium aerolatum]
MARRTSDLIDSTLDALFRHEASQARPAAASQGAEPGFRPPPSRSEAKADETTRAVRAMTEAAAETRAVATARLREARKAKEAQARAEAEAAAALAPAKAPRKRKAKAT